MKTGEPVPSVAERRGQFAELIQEIGVASVEERLLEAIERELSKSMSIIDGSAEPAEATA